MTVAPRIPHLNRFFSVTLILSVLSASFGAFLVEHRNPEVTDLDITGAPDGIVFIADPHVREENMPLIRETIREINAMHPSLVLIGGDFVFGSDDDLAIQSVWSELDAPTYAILGNHDYRSGDKATTLVKKLTQIRQTRLSVADYDLARLNDGTADAAYADRVAAALEANGVHVLRNQSVDLEIDGKPVRLVGLDDGWAGRAKPPVLESTDAFTIYMIHEPDCAAPWDADLILAGHTHGGQFLPAGVADRLGLSGENSMGDAVMYVTRGIGTSNLPREVRATAPEIVRIVSE
ncbi:MAG: metallophosphoesterase [Methanospirillum sp.]